MATTISLYEYDGYPLDYSMRYGVTLTVTYSGSYKIHFYVYEESSGDVAFDGFGTTFSMSANGSITKDDDFYKTFTGLTEGTRYAVVATLWNATTNTSTGVMDAKSFQTTAPIYITVNYYDGSSYDIDRKNDYIELYEGSRSGWTFVGWATSTSTTSVSYYAGDKIYAGSSSRSVDLYAVYKKESTIYCFYVDGSNGNLISNERTKIQYRVNITYTSVSEGYYNTITLPTFGSIHSSITTSTPDRTWSVLGWHRSASAVSPDYSPGQSVSTDRITGNLYAVYSNECSITYNSNGGSGSMTKQTGTGYYNAVGNYKGVLFTVKDCSFTPPSGKKFDSWNAKSDGSGTEYSSGETVTTSYNTIFYAIWVKARPSNWSWSTDGISKGSDMNYTPTGTSITPTPLTATEWLAFMDRIKEFYAYDNDKTVDDTYWYRAVNGVSSGSPMTATQVNGARYLISQLSIQTALPNAVASGTGITAAFINGLKKSLNSIP